MKKNIFNSQIANLDSRWGFTLIELLVAMAIIGIMAGVVLVSVTSYRTRARETAALQTVSSVMPAAMKCALGGKTMPDLPVAGQPVCEGSSFTWPSLATSSTQGWIWEGAGGDSSNPDYWYVICGPNSSCDPGQKYIGCPVTSTGWTDDSGVSMQPGTCFVGTININ
jgi:prepilin-type N-terminal cleavage/methylation domain-containing protein